MDTIARNAPPTARPDCENLAHMVCDVPTKPGDTVGDLSTRDLAARSGTRFTWRTKDLREDHRRTAG